MSVMPFTAIVATGVAAAGVAATVFLALVVLAATGVCCALVGTGNVAVKPTIAKVKDKGRLRVKVSSLKRARIEKSPSEYHNFDAVSEARRWKEGAGSTQESLDWETAKREETLETSVIYS